jgi:hypothetical protein
MKVPLVAMYVLIAAMPATMTTISAYAAEPRAPVGTFSNFKYNAESGDLGGFEIKIVPTIRGFQGALLFSEGVPREFMIVAPVFERNRVRFTVPASYEIYGGTTFDGVFDTKAIRGRFQFPGGGAEDVVPHRRGHWDSVACPRPPAQKPRQTAPK